VIVAMLNETTYTLCQLATLEFVCYIQGRQTRDPK